MQIRLEMLTGPVSLERQTAHSPGQSEKTICKDADQFRRQTVQGATHPRASNIRGPLPSVRWQLLVLKEGGSTERAPARNCGLRQEMDPTNRDPERKGLGRRRHSDSLPVP